MPPIGGLSGKDLPSRNGRCNKMRAIDGIQLTASPLQRLLDRVFPDSQNVGDFPIGLAGSSELNTFGFPGTELSELLIGKRPHHVLQTVVGCLANDLQFGNLGSRKIRH